MNKINKLSIIRGAGIAAAVLWLAGCDALLFGVTPIRDITAAPANFEGKEVKLKGKVASITKLPLVDMKSYTLRDDTGEITVTTQGALPAVNDGVGVRGTVKSTAIIGGHSLGLRVEESKRF